MGNYLYSTNDSDHDEKKNKIHINYYIEDVMNGSKQLIMNSTDTINDMIHLLTDDYKDIDLRNDYIAVSSKIKLYTNKRFCCNNIKDYSTISFVLKHKNNRGIANIYEDLTNERIVFMSNNIEYFEMKSMHLSCRCDKYEPNTNYIGLILYQYKSDNGIWQQNWILNYINCQSGYIIIKKTDSLIEMKNKSEKTWHAALYETIFKQLPTHKIMAAGFAIQKKKKTNNDFYKLYFNSRTFNKVISWKNKDDPVGMKQSNDNYHNNEKFCNQLETKWIAIAMERWKNGIKLKEESNIQINIKNDCCQQCVERILQTKY